MLIFLLIYTSLFLAKKPTSFQSLGCWNYPKALLWKRHCELAVIWSSFGTLRLRQTKWETTDLLFMWKATVRVVRLLTKGYSLENPCDFLYTSSTDSFHATDFSRSPWISLHWELQRSPQTHALPLCRELLPTSMQRAWTLPRLVLSFEHIHHGSSPASEGLSPCPQAPRGLQSGQWRACPLLIWLFRALWPGVISWCRIAFSLGKVCFNYLCYLTSETYPPHYGLKKARNMKSQIPFVPKLMRLGQGECACNLGAYS